MLEISPKDFYECLQKNVFNDDFKILIDGHWFSFKDKQIDHTVSPYKSEHSFLLKGGLLLDKELDHVSITRTVARIGDKIIPCEIVGFENEYEHFHEQSINGVHRIYLTIYTQYSSYDYKYGDVTDTINDIPKELEHLIAIQDDPKKKTFFDWIDLT